MSGGIQKIFRRDNQPFTMVPNELIRDPEITPNAFRLLSYLMSHENGYEITYGQIERQTGLGRYAINEAVKLLGEKGWLEVARTKVSNGQAKRLFIQSESQLEEMMDGVRRLAADPNLPEKQFIPHPATWLRRCGWLDEPYPERHERRTNAEKAMDLVRYYEAQEQGEIES
jgi:predicted transcriptional regulator